MGLINGEMQGPLVASGDWRSSIPFSLEGVTVNRNGAASNLGAIQENDVIYWNQSMRTLWVSSEKVMGDYPVPGALRLQPHLGAGAGPHL